MIMNDQEIIEAINAALVEEFELDIEEMVPEANLFLDLELDSLDMVDMVIVLEQTFKIKVRDEKAIRKIRTLEDLYNFVINKKREMEKNV
jgi:acyl carrier protein